MASIRLSTAQNWLLHLATAAATAAGLFYAYQLGRQQARPHKKVFVLAVWMTFKNVDDRDKWVAHFKAMVDHVKENEPETVSYELAVADNDPCKVLVYERYTNRAAYEGPHRTSEAMAKFKEATKDIKRTVQGQSYIETNIGFM